MEEITRYGSNKQKVVLRNIEVAKAVRDMKEKLKQDYEDRLKKVHFCILFND